MMFGVSEPRRYEAPMYPMPNVLLAKAARECARHIVRHHDPDRARAAAIEAFQRILDIACRDEETLLADMTTAMRRTGM